MHAPRRLPVESRTRALFPVVLVGLLFLGVTGCATTPRKQLLERSAAYVAYSLPSEQVLEAAREVLEERGYLIQVSRDPNYVRTDWRTKFDDSLDAGSLRERQFVVGKELEDGRYVVTAYRLTYTTIGRTAPHPASFRTNEQTGQQRMIKGDPLSNARPALTRDLELEWEILSRVSPSIARELETQVDEYLGTDSK